MPPNTALKVEEITTFKINEIEIFSAGEWNDDTYTVEDLHQIVAAFDELKNGFRPYLKLGHDEKQNTAKSSGLPSIGWVDRLYVRGTKLLADFDYIPEKIYKLIKSRAYRKVSCEIYWDLSVDGKKYPRCLGAVALLGAENPGVMNLDDILGNYHLLHKKRGGVFDDMEKHDSFKSYAFNFDNVSEDLMEAKKLEEVETELAEHKKNYVKSEADKIELLKTITSQTDELKQYRLDAEKAKAEAQTAKVEKFVLELENKKLVSPSMKDLIVEMCSDKKEYTVKEKKYSREELITEVLTIAKENAKVNFTETTKADFGAKKDKTKELDEEIKKFAIDNGCSYAQAYKAVMKDKKSEQDEE